MLTSRQSMPSTEIFADPLFDSNNGGWRKYTMPVLSPRRSASSALTGSYRTTFSSSSIDRPYYSSSTNSYTPRSTSYISRNYSRTIEDNREKSVRRDSLETTSVSVIRDTSTTRGIKSSASTVADSVADLRSRYSPANYVPTVLRGRNERNTPNENILRSKSINEDIGRPPLEVGRKEIRKKVNDSFVCNRVVFTSSSSNNTNNGTSDNNVISDTDDANGNRNSVAEICKKFDSKPSAAATASIVTVNNLKTIGSNPRAENLLLEGTEIKLSENRFKKLDSLKRHKTTPTPVPSVPAAVRTDSKTADSQLSAGVSVTDGPKCNKILSTSKIANGDSNGIANLKVYSDNSSEPPQASNGTSIGWSSDFETPLLARNNNHTTDFASYIPFQQGDGSAPDTTTTGTAEENAVMERNGGTNHAHYQGKSPTPTKDLSTSPRLNRAISQGSPSPSTSGPSGSGVTSNNVYNSRTPTSLERDRDASLSSSGGPSAHAIRSLGLNGLKNIGNTCFMNSVIQCLSNTRQLLEYVKKDGYVLDINTTNSAMKGALIKAFGHVIKELWSEDSSDRVVNTLALKNQIQRFAPRFMGYSQQDAQEFLRYLLEGLHEDVNRVTVKPTPIHTEIDEKLSDAEKANEAWQRYLRIDNSRIVDIFVGQLKSTLRCTHCGHCSVTFDPFWDLSLPIPQRQGQLRLAQCLEYFTREETLDGDEKPTCSKCKERRKCTKSFTIQKFPKILVIHLKRFSPTERFRGKLGVTVDFPLEGLDMRAYAAADSPSECRYNLYAISNHSGTTYSGHYTAYCRHPYSHAWHEYNDSRVSSISARSTVSGEAYVLFYELESQKSHL